MKLSISLLTLIFFSLPSFAGSINGGDPNMNESHTVQAAFSDCYSKTETDNPCPDNNGSTTGLFDRTAFDKAIAEQEGEAAQSIRDGGA